VEPALFRDPSSFVRWVGTARTGLIGSRDHSSDEYIGEHLNLFVGHLTDVGDEHRP